MLNLASSLWLPSCTIKHRLTRDLPVSSRKIRACWQKMNGGWWPSLQCCSVYISSSLDLRLYLYSAAAGQHSSIPSSSLKSGLLNLSPYHVDGWFSHHDGLSLEISYLRWTSTDPAISPQTNWAGAIPWGKGGLEDDGGASFASVRPSLAWRWLFALIRYIWICRKRDRRWYHHFYRSKPSFLTLMVCRGATLCMTILYVRLSWWF